jgi:hypothetical protein
MTKRIGEADGLFVADDVTALGGGGSFSWEGAVT